MCYLVRIYLNLSLFKFQQVTTLHQLFVSIEFLYQIKQLNRINLYVVVKKKINFIRYQNCLQITFQFCSKIKFTPILQLIDKRRVKRIRVGSQRVWLGKVTNSIAAALRLASISSGHTRCAVGLSSVVVTQGVHTS